MKNMKRFLALGMVACMVMGSMTACGHFLPDLRIPVLFRKVSVSAPD